MSSLRLVCPGCGAQYDVPRAVIPPEGRDVQCASCGETWFEPHPDDGPSEATSGMAPPPAAQETDAEAHAPQSARAPGRDAMAGGAPATAQEVPADDPGAPPPDMRDSPEPPATSGHDHDDGPEEPWEDDLTTWPGDAPDESPPAAQPRRIDPAMRALFQEEREHEERQRQAESAPMESQPDLGLRPAPNTRYDPRRQTPAQPGPMDGPGTQSRRDRLPAIEEIDRTLRDGTEMRMPSQRAVRPGLAEDYDFVDPEPRSRFGLGFALPVILAALAAGAYLGAPRLVDLVPEAEPWITRYVALADAGRAWLGSQAADIRAMLAGL